MLGCWRTIDRVMDVWEKREPSRLFDDYFRGWLTEAILPLKLKDEGNLLFTVAKGFREDNRMQRRLSNLTEGDDLRLLRTAHAQIGKAVRLAPADKCPVYLWDDGEAVLTCRQYAALQAEAIEIVICMKQSQIHLLGAGKIGDKTKAFEDIAKRELANSMRLTELLKSRKRWMQSPRGRKFLNVIISQIQGKINVMDLYLRCG